MKFRNRFLLLLMLVAAGQSAALTLGRMRGAALVGQPLDVLVQIQLNADEPAGGLCLEADVFHADTRQDENRVRVTLEPTAQPSTVNARVRSSSYIDEPMVTVYLRAGCAQKSSRRYVLLADFPSDASLPVLAPSAFESAPTNGVDAGTAAGTVPATPPNSATSPSGNVSGSATGSSVRREAAPQAAAPKPVRSIVAPKPRPATVAKPAKSLAQALPKTPAPVAVQAKTPAPPLIPDPASPQAAKTTPTPPQAALAVASAAKGQPRLKLDPLTVVPEQVASLASSARPPSADGPRDALADAQRMQSLEDNVKTLVALAAKNEASLQELKVRLQVAEAAGVGRVPMQWLYGLVALVLACLAMMVYVWSRVSVNQSPSGTKDDWWRAGRGGAAPMPSAGVAAAAPVTATAMPAGQTQVKDRTVSAPAGLQGAAVESRYSSLTGLEDDPASELDVSLVEMTESNFDQLMKSGKSHSAIRPGPLSLHAEPLPATTQMQALKTRPINSERLFDVRQQAEFFVSLGQTDQAVQILEKQINDHGETSPLIYLDLLQIFHSLNLKTDFRQFREDFNLLFNARVPEFAAFRNEGKNLEEYPHVLAHITALWSTRKALMVIEASIFRDSLDDRSTPFDLAAFRDLLLLHAIAQSFTIREEPTSDLAPLRANMSPISKGAGLSELAVGGGKDDARGTVDLALPSLSGVGEVDIPLNSSGVGLLPIPDLPSVTGVLNAPTTLDPIAGGTATPSPGAAFNTLQSGSGRIDLELDLDLSDLVALSPAQKSSEDAVSDFSKLLNAQAHPGHTSRVPKASAASVELAAAEHEAKAAKHSDYLADNLLDFDLSSENASLGAAKPIGNKGGKGEQ